jgi:hypothetical protein
MASHVLLYVGSVIITVWGIAHIVPTQSIVRGFGVISDDNRRIITLEWVGEGLTLCFIGVLVFLVTLIGGGCDPVSFLVYRASAIMLAALALLSAFTGARTSVVPMKVCPFVKTVTAVLFVLGSAV